MDDVMCGVSSLSLKVLGCSCWLPLAQVHFTLGIFCLMGYLVGVLNVIPEHKVSGSLIELDLSAALVFVISLCEIKQAI